MTIVVEAMAQDLKTHRPQGGRAVGAPARPGVVRAGAGCPRGAAGEPVHAGAGLRDPPPRCTARWTCDSGWSRRRRSWGSWG